ncbi:M56 family metallopeptidase [Chitinophaga sp.]|uniref:M56 family metallopeptidase n=1 Tax=Chitinophaga sp. TaxID=1869181 RepID=UPI002F9223A9
MTVLLTYLAKVIVCSAVLYAYYYIALRNNRFHQWNRYYLVLITIVSLLTPLLQIPLPGQTPEPSTVLSYTSRIITLRESVIPVRPAINAISAGTIINLAYTLVIALLLTRILVSLLKIKKLIRNSQVQQVPPYRFVKNEDIKAPFSFFTYIFWDKHTSLNSPEGQQILKHELVHLQEQHSTDKLFMEIVTAVCWINPFFHLIKRELALVHEFLADKKAAGEEVAGYAQTILQMAFQTKQFSFTNDFFHPPIKRRILMLTQFHTPRFSYLRRILVLPLAAFIFCSLAFVVDKHPSAIRALSTTATTATVSFTPPEAAISAAPGDTSRKPKVIKPDANEVFTFVEKPPVFKGGEDSLTHYLSRYTRYPRVAQENNISGTVFVQFIVDKDGSIKQAKTVGAKKGGGLEEEAIRVVSSMPKWTPGKQSGKSVAVQFNLPIRFELDTDGVMSTPPSKEEIFTQVEQPPTFPGGEEALAKYLSKSIRYPRAAQEKNTSGTVFIQYIINNDGTIRDVKSVGAIKGNGLEEEGIRVVKNMPVWKPGKQNGRFVAVQYNLPIRFTLQQ